MEGGVFFTFLKQQIELPEKLLCQLCMKRYVTAIDIIVGFYQLTDITDKRNGSADVAGHIATAEGALKVL